MPWADEMRGRAHEVTLDDPRERQDWFLRLDEDAQDVVRKRWADDARLTHDLDRRVRRRGRAELLDGVGTLLIVHLVVMLGLSAGGLHLWALQPLLAAGAGWALGLVWRALDAGVLRCIVTAMVGSALFEAVLVGWGWIDWPALVLAPWIAGNVGALMGFRRVEIPGS